MKSLQVYRLLLPMMFFWMMFMPPKAWATGHLPQGETLKFYFYGQTLNVPKLKTVEVPSVCNADVATAWHKYKKRDVGPVLKSLRSLSTDLGLNDWFVFQLVCNYTDALLWEGSPMDRVLLEHYLMVGLGYEVRLARTTSQLMLLVPFEQEVYERDFVRAGGRDYYLFYDDLEADKNERSVIYPCDPSPEILGKGHTISLLFDGEPLKLRSGKEKPCELDDGKIRLACTVNEGVMDMLHDYPLMDIRCYVTSVVMPQFQDSILEQLKPQLEMMNQCEAANALLHFVQHLFDYENDRKNHGREKAYFVEENFYYDKNDCEDRSILYAFLVRSLLDLDVQIVQYPGHECTAVHFTDCLTYGSGYYVNGDFYLICDPSFIGASIGRCMPRFRTLQPQVYTMKNTTAGSAHRPPLQPSLDDIVMVPDLPKVLVSL